MKEPVKFFGKAPVGTKGQIVIPAEARKMLGIEPGDNVIIMSGPPHHKKKIEILSEKEFNKFLDHLESHLHTMKEGASKKKS